MILPDGVAGAVAASPQNAGAHGHHPTILAANLFLAVGIALLVLTSLVELPALARYGVGIAVEVALAGLALLLMRLEHLDIRGTALLRRPELRDILLSVLAVPGLWVAGVCLNLLSSAVLGYTSPTVPSQFPRTGLEALALAITTVVVAPLCEELMFRGYVQRAYGRRHPLVGIAGGAAIFVLYHLRFQGAPALVPVALALSFIGWRTQSLAPGIALHAAYNSIATVLMVGLSFAPAQPVGALTAAWACLAVILTPVSVGALWLLSQGTQPRQHLPEIRTLRWKRWVALIPALGLLGLYGYAAIAEVVVGAFPQLISAGPIQLGPAPPGWEVPVTWHYSVQSTLGEDLGEAICTRTDRGTSIQMTCEASYRGYDPMTGFPGGLGGIAQKLHVEADSWSFQASWAKASLAVTTFDSSQGTSDQDDRWLQYRLEKGRPTVSRDNGQPSVLSKSAGGSILLQHEWAWRLAALPLRLSYAGDASVVAPTQVAETQLRPALVTVTGGEPVWTPAGTFAAWKVVLTWHDEAGQDYEQAAWYDANAPHTLVRYDDGVVTYVFDSQSGPDPETD